jgi:hypothetical protein
MALRSDCSLRSLRLALVAAAFLTCSQTKSVSARSFVQGSGAPAWLHATARDFRRSQPIFELLAHRAVDPPPSSSLAEEERLRSLLLRATARDFRRSQLSLRY